MVTRWGLLQHSSPEVLRWCWFGQGEMSELVASWDIVVHRCRYMVAGSECHRDLVWSHCEFDNEMWLGLGFRVLNAVVPARSNHVTPVHEVGIRNVIHRAAQQCEKHTYNWTKVERQQWFEMWVTSLWSMNQKKWWEEEERLIVLSFINMMSWPAASAFAICDWPYCKFGNKIRRI